MLRILHHRLTMISVDFRKVEYVDNQESMGFWLYIYVFPGLCLGLTIIVHMRNDSFGWLDSFYCVSAGGVDETYGVCFRRLC